MGLIRSLTCRVRRRLVIIELVVEVIIELVVIVEVIIELVVEVIIKVIVIVAIVVLESPRSIEDLIPVCPTLAERSACEGLSPPPPGSETRRSFPVATCSGADVEPSLPGALPSSSRSEDTSTGSSSTEDSTAGESSVIPAAVDSSNESSTPTGARKARCKVRIRSLDQILRIISRCRSGGRYGQIKLGEYSVKELSGSCHRLSEGVPPRTKCLKLLASQMPL